MLVQEVMTRQPTTATRETTVKHAAEILAELHISSLPVLDDSGRVCGVVSEADLIRDAFVPDARGHMRSGQYGENVVPACVEDVMTPHAITTHESTDIADVADLMTASGIKSVPVIDDDGRLVGVVSRSDLVKVRARADDVIERELDARLVDMEHADWLVQVSDGCRRDRRTHDRGRPFDGPGHREHHPGRREGQRARAMSTPSKELLRQVLTLACRAPSVHNSQPWLWRILDDSTVELYADRDRQLPVADPEGRNLAISCGAALHHAQEAAKALGLSTTVDLPADPTRHELLARIHVTAGHAPTDAAERLHALEQRCTDRRRFTSWPVPDTTLTKLAEAASGWGAYAIPITDVTARFRAELLMERAMTVQASDRRYADEQASWIEHGPLDGVPSTSAAPAPSRTTGGATEPLPPRDQWHRQPARGGELGRVDGGLYCP